MAVKVNNLINFIFQMAVKVNNLITLIFQMAVKVNNLITQMAGSTFNGSLCSGH